MLTMKGFDGHAARDFAASNDCPLPCATDTVFDSGRQTVTTGKLTLSDGLHLRYV